MLGPTPLNTGTFVTVDIETTGCRPGTSSVLEIGAARIEAGVITAHFSMLVCPRSAEPIPPAISHLTGITPEMVAAAPPIDEAIELFREFVGSAVLVAHNHRFDMSFLDYEAECAWGSPFPRPVLDTLTLARRLHPELPRHNLRDLAAHYEASAIPSHRALPDALATAEVFVRMLPDLDSAGIATAAEVAKLTGIAQQSGLAKKLALATHIPDEPGIYLFRDADGRVIFVGRAKSLRTRVRNHFYAVDDGCPSPASEAAAISFVSLVSALDAALLEVRLQDRYVPAYNRDGHQARHPLYLHLDVEADYPSMRPVRRRLRSGELIGPLSNEWAAETLADAVSEFFGLRRCRCALDTCESRDCSRRREHACAVPDGSQAGHAAYVSGVRAALSVFNGRGPDFREMLKTMQERSAAAERYEDAARYRDAARALDRTLSALTVARRAAAEEATVVIEGDADRVAAIVLVRGWHLCTIRFTRSQVASGAFAEQLRRAVARARRHASANSPVTARRLRDIAIIDAYRQQHCPTAIVIGDDHAAAAAASASAIRRLMRVPRKRHGAFSDA